MIHTYGTVCTYRARPVFGEVRNPPTPNMKKPSENRRAYFRYSILYGTVILRPRLRIGSL